MSVPKQDSYIAYVSYAYAEPRSRDYQGFERAKLPVSLPDSGS